MHPAWWIGTQIDSAGQFQPIVATDWQPGELSRWLDQEEMLLHDLRKVAKRTRYQMGLFTDYYPEPFQRLLKQIKAVQEVLGNLQDCYVLRGMIEDCLDVGLADLSPELCKLFQQQRLQLWTEWQPLQQQFLTADYRRACRRLSMEGFH